MTLEEELILATGSLARAAPKEFSDFVAKYRVHKEQLVELMLSQAGNDLYVAQGMAREATKRLDSFTDAPKKADVIAEKLKARGH